jgi:O-antigen ligase
MKYIKNLKLNPEWLFFLFPFFLISGPFLPDLFISSISLFFFIKVLTDSKKYNLFKNYIFYFLIIFYFYININSFFSYKPSISFQTSIPYVRLILFAFFLSYFLNIFLNLKKIIIISFISSYAVLLSDSLLQLITGTNLLGYPIINNRISSFFGDWLIMGSFVSRTLPLVIGLLFLEKFKYKFFLQILTFFICGILVYLSAERLSFAYYVITLTLFIFFIFNKKNILFILLAIFTFFLFLHFLKPSSTQRIINHSINQFEEGKKISLFSYRHELHFVTAYNIFRDNIFFGGGLKSFRFLCDNDKFIPIDKILTDNTVKSPTDGFVYKKIVANNDISLIITKNPFNSAELELAFNNKSSFHYLITADKQLVKFYKENGDSVHKDEPIFAAYDYKNGCNTHPHNILLQFLSELGLVGFIFLLVAFYFLIKKISFIIIKKIKDKNLHGNEYLLFFTLLGLSLNLFPLFPSGNFFNNWLSVVFYFYIGFLIYTLKKKNKL